MPVCERCSEETLMTTKSYFNAETICMGCVKVERGHPDFQKAHEAEVEQVIKKNFNFEGVGAPFNLKELSATARLERAEIDKIASRIKT